MTAAQLLPIAADLGELLRRLQQQLSAADEVATAKSLAELGPQRALAPLTLVGALCIGGLDFAAQLVASQHPGVDQAECCALVVDAFFAVVEAPADAPADHEQQVAQALIDGFGLALPAAALLDAVRAELLISVGPIEELPEAVLAAMRLQQWELALRGLVRLRQTLQQRTPRNAYGWAAMCLHKLGRLEEAEQWSLQGLGDDARLIAIGPVHTEAELLQRWGRYDKPVVSIICTTYNHERYIDSTIRGFLSQDCRLPFEILIHDDASTDGTQAIIRRWQALYPALIKPVLQTENQFSKGIRPFELLLARAQGGFVATCEGDDFWVDPHKLHKQVGFLQSHAEYSCTAHNYYHLLETTLTVKPWSKVGRDFVLTERQLMNVQLLLWLPTLVFRKTFSTLPPERGLAAIGDQFLTSFLGTQGRCMYFETMLGAVRRENEFSIWSPLPQLAKERMRIKTWGALALMHGRLGQRQAVADLMAKIKASPLDGDSKSQILDAMSNVESDSPRSACGASPQGATPVNRQSRIHGVRLDVRESHAALSSSGLET